MRGVLCFADWRSWVCLCDQAGLLALKAIPATVIDPRKPRGKCPPPRTAAALERAGRTKYLKYGSAVRNSQCSTSRGSFADGAGMFLCRFVHSMFDGDTGSTEVIKLAQGCSLIVGLHPDEATEVSHSSRSLSSSTAQCPMALADTHSPPLCQPIVATAVRYKKPFAVVPCCVFPDLFPHRKQSDGKR